MTDGIEVLARELKSYTDLRVSSLFARYRVASGSPLTAYINDSATAVPASAASNRSFAANDTGMALCLPLAPPYLL